MGFISKKMRWQEICYCTTSGSRGVIAKRDEHHLIWKSCRTSSVTVIQLSSTIQSACYIR